MAVARLKGENFRLYPAIAIEPHRQLNLIVGANAEGKTSVLEALYAASRGRSFRAQNLAELAGPAQPSWTVFVEARQLAAVQRVGVGWSRTGLEIRLNDQRDVRVSDLVQAVPLQLIDPLAHRLLDEGPGYRRSFIDWGVFHVEHRFLEVWRRYQRALKQRNRSLRENMGMKAAQAWNEELANQGEELTLMRSSHVSAVAAPLTEWTKRLLGSAAVRCEWQRGWPEDETLRSSLERNYEQHQRMGTTVQGPHRAELRILWEDGRAKGRISRGQQKMLVAAMVLAQAELLIAAGVSAPIILLDDFAAELAPEFQARLAEGLMAYPGQKFVTAFEEPAGFGSAEGAMFHVEHGTVRPTARMRDQLN